MPPRAPTIKPRPVRRRSSGPTAPGPPECAPAAAAAEPVQTHAPIAIAIAPPTGRLDSLVSAAAAAARASRDGSADRGRGVAGPLKFKPRNVARKSKEEREALDAKFEVAVTPAPRSRGGASSRGPRGGRGGRGGPRERDGREAAAAGASGPFALGSVTTRDRAQKITVERGGYFSKYHQQPRPRHNTKQGHETDKLPSLETAPENPAPEDPGYSSSSSDSEGPRMDVEYISILDDAQSDGENDDMQIEPTWGAGAPIRVPRSAHVDRAAQVNTEVSSSRKSRADRSRRGNKVLFEELVKVEHEPPGGGDDALLPNIPEADKKKSRKPRSSESKRAISAKRRRSSAIRNKIIVSTVEGREELQREAMDRATTLKELAGGFADVKIDSDSDTGQPPPHHRNAETENQIFLFQFPNILPQLVLPSKHKEQGDAKTPAQPEQAPEEPLRHHHPSRPSTILQRKSSAKAQQALLESYPPPGIAGKLRIHKSGRMTMLWGVPTSAGEDDTPFEMDMSRGTQCEFLQELVAMRKHSPWGDQDVDERGKRKGVVFSLGQVKGKFIVSPDFEKLLKGDKKKKGKGKGKGKGKNEERGEFAEVGGLVL